MIINYKQQKHLPLAIKGMNSEMLPSTSPVEMDLSRLRSGLSVHLSGLSFESQGAFTTE